MKKIGFVNVYAYRPHGHHAKYLELLSNELGYRTISLDCFGAPQACYTRELKGAGRLACIACSLGGLHSFKFSTGESVRKYWDPSISGNFDEMVKSSAYTLTRIEAYEEKSLREVSSVVNKLSGNAYRFYYAVKSWIEAHSLDAVLLFNGRMDYTRAVLESCKDMGVICITHERPLYGHGIILNRDENCSSFKNVHRINKKYGDKPLAEEQVRIAAFLAAQRLSGGNTLEWRRHNQKPIRSKSWPIVDARKKILFCPSSKNEMFGHPDRETPWKDNTDALDYAEKNGVFSYNDLLVRFHPYWAESFGVITGERCEKHYQSWCEARGVSFISSKDKLDTKDLIRQADVVFINGSSTILEAAVLGKPVVCFGSSHYTYSGSSIDVLSFNDIEKLKYDEIVGRDPRQIAAKTLRYFYTAAVREPVYADYVRSKTVTECDFYSGADPSILESIIFGEGEFDGDYGFADTSEYEEEVVNAFLSDDPSLVEKFSDFGWESNAHEALKVTRRGLYRLVDDVRRLFPKGA